MCDVYQRWVVCASKFLYTHHLDSTKIHTHCLFIVSLHGLITSSLGWALVSANCVYLVFSLIFFSLAEIFECLLKCKISQNYGHCKDGYFGNDAFHTNIYISQFSDRFPFFILWRYSLIYASFFGLWTIRMLSISIKMLCMSVCRWRM